MNKNFSHIKITLVRSTILACITVTPSLAVFFIMFYLNYDLLVAGIAGGIVHFISLGFAIKIYKRIAGFKI
ncbi:MAG: putative membrane protein [Cenarchaeum symbiont of Oopsacas minuta]|nr:putative membrane protein [Cenarchaeum symbiont of Oopsacas minuta]